MRVVFVACALAPWPATPGYAGTTPAVRPSARQNRAQKLATLHVHTHADRPIEQQHDASIGVVDLGYVWRPRERQRVYEAVDGSPRGSLKVQPFRDRVHSVEFADNDPAPLVDRDFAALIGAGPAAGLARRTDELNTFIRGVAPRLRLEEVLLRSDHWARRMAAGTGFATQSQDPNHRHPFGTLTFTQAEIGVGSGHPANPDGEGEGRLLLFGSQVHFTPEAAQHGRRLLAIWYYMDRAWLEAKGGNVSGADR